MLMSLVHLAGQSSDIFLGSSTCSRTVTERPFFSSLTQTTLRSSGRPSAGRNRRESRSRASFHRLAFPYTTRARILMTPDLAVADRAGYVSSPRRVEESPSDWRRGPHHLAPQEFITRGRPKNRRSRPLPLRRRFIELADRWERETAFESVTPLIISHPDYLAVIALGPRAVGLILERMNHKPAPWFAALTALTGEDPAQDAQTLDQAVSAWLRWGSESSVAR
jgi:hypothetical protein